jgi:hypothetical protein
MPEVNTNLLPTVFFFQHWSAFTNKKIGRIFHHLRVLKIDADSPGRF